MTSKKIEVGDIFETRTGSKAEVVHYESCTKVWVQFLDDVGYIRPFEASDLKKKGFKNPFQPNIYGKAYVGVGKYKSSDGGRGLGMAEAYKYWFQMIRRCYDKNYHERQPSYKGCSAYEPWLNYNVFAEWYYSQSYAGLGYHLDKDLLVRGNKIYSPETCCLLPRDLNNLIMGENANKGDYPVGVTKDPRGGGFIVRISKGGERVRLGKYNCYKEAGEVYVKAKESHVNEMAEKYIEHIDKKVYDALLNWKV